MVNQSISHRDTNEIDTYCKQGFRQFHCSNTLPTPKGGLSGRTLMSYNEKIICYLRQIIQM